MNELLTAQEVASILKVHPRTVYVWLRQGELQGVKVGDTWRVREQDLKKFIRERLIKKGE